MEKDLVIFGAGKIAEVVYYYAKEECGFNVAAFTADAKYISEKTFAGLPVVPFEEIAAHYPPEKFDLFIAVGYHDLNKVREQKYQQALELGYTLVNIVSPLANVPKNVKLGKNCFIMPPAFIHPHVSIGNNTFVWNGAIVGHHSTVEDHCWITSGCSIAGGVTIGRNSFLAINATVGHSVTVGPECFIGANALVTKNLEEKKVVIAESSKPIRLNSDQFLRLSKFSSL
jgi:sugar O-acyltransferase (sialic acid O-acetyltransferase NeuD family)